MELTCTGASGMKIELSGDAGTYYSNFQSTASPTDTPTVYTLGGPGDRWQVTPGAPPIGWKPPVWKPRMFNDGASFRVRLKPATKPAYPGCEPGHTWSVNVDYIWVYVWYASPEGVVGVSRGRVRK